VARTHFAPAFSSLKAQHKKPETKQKQHSTTTNSKIFTKNKGSSLHASLSEK